MKSKNSRSAVDDLHKRSQAELDQKDGGEAAGTIAKSSVDKHDDTFLEQKKSSREQRERRENLSAHSHEKGNEKDETVEGKGSAAKLKHGARRKRQRHRRKPPVKKEVTSFHFLS